jgi:hypothetical protein
MKESQNAFKLLLLSSALTIAFWFIPYGEMITYPLRLFVTYVHETGHALAGLLTFGSVLGMRIFADGSGETYVRGGISFLVSSAGYLGSTLFGALLLFLCHQGAMAKKILAAISLGLLAITIGFSGFGYLPLVLSLLLAGTGILWFSSPRLSPGIKALLASIAGISFFALLAMLTFTNSLFGWFAGLSLSVVLFLAARFLQPRAAHFLLSFLAVQCCLNAIFDLKTLILLSSATSTHTDAINMQSMTGIPAIVWALCWSTLSIVILGIALWSYRHALKSSMQTTLR